ncbi:MAG TPA: response regulator [Vitreimonas sp.]|nr:response regulator [Vitreimonas sp.]
MIADYTQTIVVAEDDPFYSSILRFKLTASGHKVIVVQDGNAVLETIRINQPRLLVLDLILPGKDGFEILKEIKTSSDLAQLKVVVLTNLSQREDRAQITNLGAEEYIIKTNISVHEMMDALSQHLDTN